MNSEAQIIKLLDVAIEGQMLDLHVHLQSLESGSTMEAPTSVLGAHRSTPFLFLGFYT